MISELQRLRLASYWSSSYVQNSQYFAVYVRSAANIEIYT